MDDYYYDDYDQMDYGGIDDELLMEQAGYVKHTLTDTWLSCIYPSVIQITTYIGTFLIWNFLFSISTQIVTKIPQYFKHLMSIFCGTGVLYFTLNQGIIHFWFYALLLTFFYRLAACKLFKIKQFGYLLTIFCIGILVAGELLESDVKLWHQIRGTQMILVMKVISMGFDLDSGKIVSDVPLSILEILGYLLCPANCILGPWVSYIDYLSSFRPSKIKWRFKWFFWIIMNLSASILFLICSNCIISSLISDNSWKWFKAYRDAMSFRFSHYFISFLSQAILCISGYFDSYGKYDLFTTTATSTSSTTNTLSSSGSKLWGFQITKPFIIEIPRSMVQVVIVWNISMHNWLKTYFFRKMRRYGNVAAIATTYTISALLHGLNFQLAAVLLSLGLITYVEYKFRQKFAIIFSACILSTNCSSSSSNNNSKCMIHENQWNSPFVLLFNGLFSLFTIINLAYLGVMFEASTQLQEQGFSYQHALEKWGSLDYFSHWFTVVIFWFYKSV